MQPFSFRLLTLHNNLLKQLEKETRQHNIQSKKLWKIEVQYGVSRLNSKNVELLSKVRRITLHRFSFRSPIEVFVDWVDDSFSSKHNKRNENLP